MPSGEKIRIQKIKKEEAKKAEKFCQGIFREMGWEEKFAYGLDDLAESFAGPGQIFLLVKKKEKIIGCAGLKRLSDKKALLKRFYLAKEFRGRGLAYLLFQEIKKFAKRNNYQAILLDVFKDNLRAKKFYQKEGFEVFKPRFNKNWLESQKPELFDYRKLEL